MEAVEKKSQFMMDSIVCVYRFKKWTVIDTTHKFKSPRKCDTQKCCGISGFRVSYDNLTILCFGTISKQLSDAKVNFTNGLHKSIECHITAAVIFCKYLFRKP